MIEQMGMKKMSMIDRMVTLNQSILNSWLVYFLLLEIFLTWGKRDWWDYPCGVNNWTIKILLSRIQCRSGIFSTFHIKLFVNVTANRIFRSFCDKSFGGLGAIKSSDGPFNIRGHNSFQNIPLISLMSVFKGSSLSSVVGSQNKHRF